MRGRRPAPIDPNGPRDFPWFNGVKPLPYPAPTSNLRELEGMAQSGLSLEASRRTMGWLKRASPANAALKYADRSPAGGTVLERLGHSDAAKQQASSNGTRREPTEAQRAAARKSAQHMQGEIQRLQKAVAALSNGAGKSTQRQETVRRIQVSIRGLEDALARLPTVADETQQLQGAVSALSQAMALGLDGLQQELVELRRKPSKVDSPNPKSAVAHSKSSAPAPAPSSSSYTYNKRASTDTEMGFQWQGLHDEPEDSPPPVRPPEPALAPPPPEAKASSSRVPTGATGTAPEPVVEAPTTIESSPAPAPAPADEKPTKGAPLDELGVEEVDNAEQEEDEETKSAPSPASNIAKARAAAAARRRRG